MDLSLSLPSTASFSDARVLSTATQRFLDDSMGSPKRKATAEAPLVGQTPLSGDLRSSKRGRGVQGEAVDRDVEYTDGSLATSSSLFPETGPAPPTVDEVRPIKPLKRSVKPASPLIPVAEVPESVSTPKQTPKTPASRAAANAPRPPNAWILYRSDQLKVIRQDPVFSKKPQSDISKLIAALWREERDVVKRYYEEQADVKKKEHLQRFPGYRFSPIRSNKSSTPALTTSMRAQKAIEPVFRDMGQLQPPDLPSMTEYRQFQPSQPLANFALGLEQPTNRPFDVFDGPSMLYRSAPAPSRELSLSVGSSMSYDHCSPIIEQAESVASSEVSYYSYDGLNMAPSNASSSATGYSGTPELISAVPPVSHTAEIDAMLASLHHSANMPPLASYHDYRVPSMRSSVVHPGMPIQQTWLPQDAVQPDWLHEPDLTRGGVL